jgi:hypothetical protein
VLMAYLVLNFSHFYSFLDNLINIINLRNLSMQLCSAFLCGQRAQCRLLPRNGFSIISSLLISAVSRILSSIAH